MPADSSTARPSWGGLPGSSLSDTLTTYTVGTTPQRIALQDGDAVYTGVFTDDTAVVTIGFDPSVTSGNGLVFPLYQPRMEFKLHEHGPLAQRALWAVAAAGTVVVAVLRVRRDLA